MSRAGAPAAVAVSLAFGSVSDVRMASAGEATPGASQVAALTLEDPIRSAPFPDRGSTSIDRLRRLAQSAPRAADGAGEDDTILVAVGLSAPEDVEEAVAKDFGVEIVSKVRLANLGVRLVRYRVPDLRPIETVLARLNADRRIIGAQLNVRYQAIPRPAPETEVGKVTEPSVPEAKQQAKQPAPERPARAEAASGRAHAGARKADRRREAATDAGAQRSARVSVGDVLSGGL
jgi:hypothetical protein